MNRFERFFRTLLDWWASSAHQPRQQHHDKDDQEDEKQDFCNTCGSERDSTKAQKPGDDRDYEKHQRPIEHALLRYGVPGVCPLVRVAISGNKSTCSPVPGSSERDPPKF